MTSARKPHSHTTAIAAGAGARIDGGRIHRLLHMGVVSIGAMLSRRDISR